MIGSTLRKRNSRDACAWRSSAIGPEATQRFFAFFMVPIRHKGTPIAYYQAIGQFLEWCQRAGFSNIEDTEPIHVAAYIKSHKGSAATVKQHMARRPSVLL
jgi:hypothetical protein